MTDSDQSRRYGRLEDDLDEVASEKPELSLLVLRAHRLEDTPGTSIEDPAQIKALLGL